ncbi:heavy-metal-associated domain-containing protein [Halococcoides cellulosivorans]|uniref:Heavy metal transporter n=1 Tax=Halococcoides cellulosivorans TaxID=1679096 RepID=A0A2R4X2C1_9EURY|nr:heavy metal-associated domain-containing protein [Halococcoides cellulosivorans]AWB27946.1 heavy metal transporter [Halococcoides cellulosivorans]
MARTYTVEGMQCTGCETTVIETVEAVEGVTDVTADHEADTVTVSGDPDPAAVRAAIGEAGYDLA